MEHGGGFKGSERESNLIEATSKRGGGRNHSQEVRNADQKIKALCPAIG